MEKYITGKTIKELREKKNMTQNDLANKLFVSDKTISKWETGNGYPDISILEKLAKALDTSIVELLSGNVISNENVSANMLKTNFYVCPICGNTILSTGNSLVCCHGITLPSLIKEIDENINLEIIEDELYVSIDHPMEKDNYISFIAAVSSDRVQLVKLYPESSAEARFKINGVKYIYYYSILDGLFYKLVNKKAISN